MFFFFRLKNPYSPIMSTAFKSILVFTYQKFLAIQLVLLPRSRNQHRISKLGISSYGSLLKINNSDGFSNQNKQQGSQRKVKFHGLIFARFVILQLKQIKGGFLGAIQIFNDEISKQIQYEIGKKNLLQTLKQHLKVYYAFKLKYQESQSQIAQINQDKNINRIIYKSCSDLDIKILDKIKLLQTSDQKLIIQALLSFLAQATQQYTQILAIEKKVREVNIESQSKRNIYRMNEQQMLLKKLKSKPYPEHVREQIEVQIKRLGVGAESTVHTKYIEILLEIPWLESTPDVKHIKLAQKILNEDHTGLIQVKQRILQFLAVSFRKGSTKGSVICLHGPPGVGKTTIAKSIAKALGRQFTRISLGGLSDEAQLRGHRRTYLGSLPGALIKALIKAKSNNPVILLDEVEKMGRSVKGGNPEHALLEILDPSQNNAFKDHYLSIPINLSQVMFICAANQLDMSAPLLNRLELIEVPGYTDQQKFQIAKNHIIPKQLKENGVEELINFQSSALEELIKRSKQMGVRQLQRNVAKVCRRAARINQKDSITGKTVTMIFGNIKNEQRWNGVGVVNSMVWTEKGGKILLVEAVKYHNSKGVIQVTGQLGTVMKQSINIALSWIRTHKNDFSIWSERIFNMSEQIYELEKISLHLHFPAGGIKKDGPQQVLRLSFVLSHSYSKFLSENHCP